MSGCWQDHRYVHTYVLSTSWAPCCFVLILFLSTYVYIRIKVKAVFLHHLLHHHFVKFANSSSVYILLFSPYRCTLTGMFGWLAAINKVDDSTLHSMVGMDHYVLLRHCRFGFNLTLMSVPTHDRHTQAPAYFCILVAGWSGGVGACTYTHIGVHGESILLLYFYIRDAVGRSSCNIFACAAAAAAD